MLRASRFYIAPSKPKEDPSFRQITAGAVIETPEGEIRVTGHTLLERMSTDPDLWRVYLPNLRREPDGKLLPLEQAEQRAGEHIKALLRKVAEID